MPLPTDQVCSRQGSATRATRRAMVPAAWTTAVALTCGGALIAQQVPPPTAPPETAAVAQTDPSSPRAALDGYLDAARREEWEDAARWLDLASVPRRRGAQLAERLDAVLARHV
nr:hypothetical protein [Gemmatimonadaceae bacterium]